MKNPNCDFCKLDGEEWRMIRSDEWMTSLLPQHRFRAGHSLVIPNRHVTTIAELDASESAAIMAEIGRLSIKLDQGYGTGLMQKYQPRQAENGIKMNHLHYHVFPRVENETGLFPVPEPNSFEGMQLAPHDETAALAEMLRQE